MKIFTLITIFCLVAGTLSFAQDDDLTRLVSKYSEKFIGTWRYETESYSITITFTKGTLAGFEQLFGTYQVQKDGKVYEDLSGTGIIGGPLPNGNSNEIVFFLNDHKDYYRQSEFKMTMQSGYKDRAVLTQIREPNRNLPQGDHRPENIILPPDNILLKKQAKRKR
ncbi:MAG: hypothetical protein LBQ60_08070 [Bacteroidales bacterium]|nr:hypothetical protein [Bacteroidales bacterium]